jgi:ribosomal protein L37AE/L43A
MSSNLNRVMMEIKHLGLRWQELVESEPPWLHCAECGRQDLHKMKKTYALGETFDVWTCRHCGSQGRGEVFTYPDGTLLVDEGELCG